MPVERKSIIDILTQRREQSFEYLLAEIRINNIIAQLQSQQARLQTIEYDYYPYDDNDAWYDYPYDDNDDIDGPGIPMSDIYDENGEFRSDNILYTIYVTLDDTTSDGYYVYNEAMYISDDTDIDEHDVHAINLGYYRYPSETLDMFEAVYDMDLEVYSQHANPNAYYSFEYYRHQQIALCPYVYNIMFMLQGMSLILTTMCPNEQHALNQVAQLINSFQQRIDNGDITMRTRLRDIPDVKQAFYDIRFTYNSLYVRNMIPTDDTMARKISAEVDLVMLGVCNTHDRRADDL